jgi:alanine racemase
VSFPLATIDSAALRHNLGVVRRLAPKSRVLAVVKADAYGHGSIGTAKTLSNADAFGVARVGEALSLRAAGIAHPLVLLEGVATAEELSAARQNQLELVVHSFEQIQMLEQAAHESFDVWLKLDTGMNRLGFRPEEFPEALRRLQACSATHSLRLMTHLAAGEERDGAATVSQIQTFQSLTASLPFERSIANSAGIIGRADAHLEWVRPGLMLYGMSPLGERSSAELGLRPAMTLSAPVIAIRTVRKGESVGYGGLWKAERDSRIAIVAIGYGDGYPRTMRNGAPVLVQDREATIAGRVSMDMIAIDVTHLPNVTIGSEVILWGADLPAERVATFADTLAYELVCRVNERVAVRRL